MTIRIMGTSIEGPDLKRKTLHYLGGIFCNFFGHGRLESGTFSASAHIKREGQSWEKISQAAPLTLCSRCRSMVLGPTHLSLTIGEAQGHHLDADIPSVALGEDRII